MPRVALLLLAVLAGACGGGADAPAGAGAEQTATPAAARVVPQARAEGIDLGTSERVVIEQLGPPAARPADSRQRCAVYATDAGPDTWLRLCFRQDRLTSYGTVIGRETALTLEPPRLDGPGTLQDPNVQPPDEQP